LVRNRKGVHIELVAVACVCEFASNRWELVGLIPLNTMAGNVMSSSVTPFYCVWTVGWFRNTGPHAVTWITCCQQKFIERR